jgi:hypothetical protein
MALIFDLETANAVFTLPRNDGCFAPDLADYLLELGESRPSVVLAFAPKAAGTYLRSAAIVATGGQLVRTVHAQGGRDASFYLPTFLLYYTAGIPARPLVTHVHMQALPANRHFITALDLKPVLMMRSIPDMLASYLDMLEDDPLSPDNWLNIEVPANYKALDDGAKADFIIDTMAPWYVSYFSTWLAFTRAEPGRVLWLDYDDFRADPAATLQSLLSHSGFARSRDECEMALAAVWDERASFRFNQGISGRGRRRFTPAQMARLKRLLAYYPELAPWTERLVPPAGRAAAIRPPSAVSPERQPSATA